MFDAKTKWKFLSIPIDSLDASYLSAWLSIGASLDNNKNIISLTKYEGTDRDIVTPKEIEGEGYVYQIGEFAFADVSDADSVEVSEGVMEIGCDAFFNTSIKKVVLPKSLQELNFYTFSHCSKLQKVLIKNDNININDATFSDCNPDLIIRCNPGSKAEEFCKRTGKKYKPIGSQLDIILNETTSINGVLKEDSEIEI